MAEHEAKLRTDITNIIAWVAILPALAFWPFLSFLPALALWKWTGTSLSISIQAVLLATGFWGVGGLFLLVYLLLSAAAKQRLFAVRRQSGILLGVYATVWTTLFLLAAFGNR